VRRVHVMGGQGSGKTTLAYRLGALLDAPVHELDWVGWDLETRRERSLDERLALVHKIAAQPAWITEGTMLGWTDPLLRAADRIVWLDVPWRVAAWRMLLRHVRATLAGNNRHPGVRRLLRFIWYTRRYYWDLHLPTPVPEDGEGNATRHRTAQRLALYPGNAARCRGHADIEAFVAALL
jgi:adenylate kinase family enzyme